MVKRGDGDAEDLLGARRWMSIGNLGWNGISWHMGLEEGRWI